MNCDDILILWESLEIAPSAQKPAVKVACFPPIVRPPPPGSSSSTVVPLWPVCFPPWGTWVQSPGGYLRETGILLLALSRYIGDPDMIDHCGLVWGWLCPEPSLGRCADNVIIPLDLTQLSCPGFTLAASPPSGFTTNTVGCWGGALWRASNLTAFIHCLTGPVGHPFASRHEGPAGSIPRGVLTWNRGSPISFDLLQNSITI